MIQKCTFMDNEAALGGGAIWGQLCDGTLVVECSFEGNTADDDGGAVYLEGYPDEDGGAFERVHLIKNVYNSNRATEGGAIYIKDKDVTISHSVFSGNRASVEGGALWCGAERTSLSDPVEIYNVCNAFSGTQVTTGSGDGECVVFLLQATDVESLIFNSFNNTIGQNTDVRGITLMNSSGTDNVLVMRCANEIIYGNSTTLTPISVNATGGYASDWEVVYSDTEQSVGGTGNITSNPQFTTFPFLSSSSPTSPCIDAGDDNAWDIGFDSTVPDEDLFSYTRIQGNAIDMGCVED